MFENELSAKDAEATIAAVEDNERTLIQAEVRRLELAAHWADLHPGETVDPAGLPGRERPRLVGGDGTPAVADFRLASLATALTTTAGSAARLLGDALDLRHRLPGTWAAVRAGQGPVYQARRVASATRHLTRQQAGQVDGRIAPRLGRVSFGRLQTLLEAYVYEADPEGADAEAEAAARERFVRLGRTSEHGYRFIMARIAAGDAAWGFALTTRLADILKREGDLDSLDVRRSKAFGLQLTQPAEVLRLLCAHQDDDPDDPDEPEVLDEPDEDAGEDPGPAPVDGSTSFGPTCSGRSLPMVPPPFDPAKARPRAVVYVHLSEAALSAGRGVVRVEEIGPVLLSRLGQLVGDHTQILLKPVIDLNDVPAPVDSYEIPDRIREHLRLRQPVDVFPFAAGGTRRMDLDHTLGYLAPEDGGPPGQTGIGKLGPHARYHHRVKTHGRWRVRQPEPGTWVWRSPEQRIFLINQTGTHALGHSGYAQQIWRAAKAPPSTTEPVPADESSHDTSNASRAEQIARAHLENYTLAT